MRRKMRIRMHSTRIFFRLNLKLIYLFMFIFSQIQIYLPGSVIRLSKPFAIKRVTFKSIFLLVLFAFLSNFKWYTLEKMKKKKYIQAEFLKPILLQKMKWTHRILWKVCNVDLTTYSTYLKSIWKVFLFSQTMEICI